MSERLFSIIYKLPVIIFSIQPYRNKVERLRVLSYFENNNRSTNLNTDL